MGTRNLNQCYNKYKDGLSRVRRPSEKDKELMKYYIIKGFSRKEIEELMRPLTSVQVQQLYKKLTSNKDPWSKEQEQKLIQWKKEGILTDTQIEHELGNKHVDDIRKKLKELRRKGLLD